MGKIAAVVFMSVFGASLVFAQQPGGPMGRESKKEMKAEKKARMKMNVCKGTVEAVDMAAGKITVKDSKGETMVMMVSPETKIMKHGKPATLSDIMVGEMVHIKYEGDMANPMVKLIKVGMDHMKKGKMEKKKQAGEEMPK